MTASDYCYVLNGDGELVRLYRMEAERELLPEEDREFYTSELAGGEFLLIAAREELLLVTAANLESREALTDAEFTHKFGFSEEEAESLQWRIWGPRAISAS